MRQGWDPRYKIWVEHDEPAPPTPPPVIDNTRQPLMNIGETSNEPTQATRNEFEELYASANEELYPGCDYVTRLDFMAKFTYFKAKGRLTDSIFNEMLEFFQNVFPISKGFKLPPSYYAIKKTFKTIGLGYESIHACEHDCCLFRGDNNKDLDFCPVCNTSRWKDSNTLGKKVPKKVLCYFPIIPRLQRFYKSSHTAKDMIWHATGKCTEPGKMQHPVDGGAWKKFDTKYPDFAKEPRNVRLGLAADGFNPFGNLSQAYSMWPVILTTYNLPPWLCMKESSFMLTLLIPGPKSPGKDIDIYLRPLIEDLKVLWTINDFPARSSLSGWSGQGYKACPTCNEDTPSVRVLSKTAYVGHIRFLKKPYKWRRSLEFNGQTDNTDPPKEFGRDVILAQLDRLPTRVKGKHPEGLIAEGYVAEEALTFSSHYFRDVTTKFNRPDRNVDPLPQRVGFRCFDRPEIDTYRSQFKRQRHTKSQFGRHGSGQAAYPRQDPEPFAKGNRGS
ncbi:retrovirus-related pol polyprotein from transposon 17.6 [Tanacetum coccineum]